MSHVTMTFPRHVSNGAMEVDPIYPSNLDNAKAIKASAEAKMMEKEHDEYMGSIDYLEAEAKSAYWNLRARVGQHRANEVMAPSMEAPF